jgi:hypothetical protein
MRAISRVARSAQWDVQDIELLESHAENLAQAGSPHAVAVQQVIPVVKVLEVAQLLRNVWIGHLIFWLLLIFAYPRFPQIQAIFFWNTWVRRLTGLGYVGLALAWIPFLRRRLFAPFRESLLADAALETFIERAYFKGSNVRRGGSLESIPLLEAIPQIKGQLILEGESGLGKTMFLRYLVKPARRITVYLPATRCELGVMEAIQAKLHGPAKDPVFLRNLVYAGAIDICIDGLNEVSADTRAKITSFLESFFKGNIILGTQPMEWRPPSLATIYRLQPLTRDQIVDFLIGQGDVMQDDFSINLEEYRRECLDYVSQAFGSGQPVEIIQANALVISNPMDLTTVARMLGQGKAPDLFHLERQQYEMMAQEYSRIYLGQPFPLERFAETVYQMRLHDEPWLSGLEFQRELKCMEQHKMILGRRISSTQNENSKVWYFRHDKIMEFFIVQSFMGTDNERPQAHLGDTRFRGVYFLLAMLLPFDDALALRERLIDYAADTRDHTVSDGFIRLLRGRKAA